MQAKEARLTILDVMAGAIPEPRSEVAESAPKIISFEIPMDKIGEVIGPKGKVINALQQETGADIAVDDDGMVGTVTIGAKDGTAVEEARRRIATILDPPLAEVGATYQGKVVNITKFGAFVNILPGRDGLLHISKMGQGKRIDRVEDVFELGQPVEVKVDDIDPQGKVSLSLAGEAPAPERLRPRLRRGSGAGSCGPTAVGGGSSRGDHADPTVATTAARAARPALPPAPPRSRTPSRRSSSRSSATSVPRPPSRPTGRAAAEAAGAVAGAVEHARRTWVGPRGRPTVGATAPATCSAGRCTGRARMIRTDRLPSGLTLVTEAMAEARSVCIGFWVGTGSRDESDELAGASHFLEHLLFKGTDDRSASAIAEAVDEVGGDFNAFTTKEYTSFYIRLLAEHVDLGLDILSDIMWRPALRAADLDAERQVILDEILMHADEPADEAAEQSSAILFPDHPLGREVLGTESSVDGHDPRPDPLRSSTQHYLPGNMVVAVAGDLDHDRVAAGLAEPVRRRRRAGATPHRAAPDDQVDPLAVTRRADRAGPRGGGGPLGRPEPTRAATPSPS